MKYIRTPCGSYQDMSKTILVKRLWLIFYGKNLSRVLIFFQSLQDGFSPLYVAAQNGHNLVVEILLKSEANANQPNKVSLYRCYMYICTFLKLIYMYTNSGHHVALVQVHF